MAESFNQYGINPWIYYKRFHQHIEHINKSGVYKALTDARAVEVLDKSIEKLMGIISILLMK